MAENFSFKQSALETPIKVVEKGGYCFLKISADVQVSDHAANLWLHGVGLSAISVPNWTSHAMPASNHCREPGTLAGRWTTV